MASPQDIVREMLAAKRRELAALDQQKVVLGAEVRTLEAVLAGLDAGAQREATKTIVHSDPDPIFAANLVRHAGNRMSDRWRDILAGVSILHRDFGYDDILQVAHANGEAINKPLARTKMGAFLKAHYVDRVEDGRFRLTLKGREIAGIEQQKAPPTVVGEANLL